MSKKTRGGKRPGAGRPESEDPKVTIRSGVKGSVVEKLGGKKKVQQIVPELLEEKAKSNS